MKRIILSLLVFSVTTSWAFDFCKDCDRGIADGKEYCNECYETRQKNSLIGTAMFLKMLDNASKAAERAEQKRREEGDRKARAEVDRMNQITSTSVAWMAHTTSSNKTYYFMFMRADREPLYAYVDDNYSRQNINNYKFKATAFADFPTIPKGTKGGAFEIIIIDDNNTWYALSDVALTYNDAKQMTIRITELEDNKIQVKVHTGVWHQDQAEVDVICDKVLSAHPEEGYYYKFPIIDPIDPNLSENDVKNTILEFMSSNGRSKYIYPQNRTEIAFPRGRWNRNLYFEEDSVKEFKNLRLNGNVATVTAIFASDLKFDFGLVKYEGTPYIVAISLDDSAYDFDAGKFEHESSADFSLEDLF